MAFTWIRHHILGLQDWQPDVVFHLAAQPLVRLSYLESVETWNTNVMGTIHVLEVSPGLKVKVVVGIGRAEGPVEVVFESHSGGQLPNFQGKSA